MALDLVRPESVSVIPVIMSGGIALLILDSFTAANGTQITSRACDTGQTPSMGYGSASGAVIQGNTAQMNVAGIYYSAGKVYSKITVKYDTPLGNSDIYFFIASGGAFLSDSYLSMIS